MYSVICELVYIQVCNIDVPVSVSVDQNDELDFAVYAGFTSVGNASVHQEHHTVFGDLYRRTMAAQRRQVAEKALPASSKHHSSTSCLLR